jgi:hypothetical protein
MPSYQSLYRRGQLGDAFFGPSTPHGTRQFTRRGVLALAAYRALTERGVEVAELSPDTFVRWVGLWKRTRGTAKPVRQLIIRYYGRPGSPGSKVSILPNDDVLPEPPAPGARLTISLDIDAIFADAEQAIARLSADPVETYDPGDGGE